MLAMKGEAIIKKDHHFDGCAAQVVDKFHGSLTPLFYCKIKWCSVYCFTSTPM